MDTRESQGKCTGEESAATGAAGAGSRSLVSNIDGESMRAMFVASSPLAARLEAEYEQHNSGDFRFNSGDFRSGRPVMFEGPPGFPVRPSHTSRPPARPAAAANSSAATHQPGQKRAAPAETTTQETPQIGYEGADLSLTEASVVHVEPGEDLSSKIIEFCLSKLHSRSSSSASVCVILSAVRAVSRATVQRNPNGFETFEGWHEIMHLGGKYERKWSSEVEVGGELERSISGGFNITLAKGDGRLIAGPVGGPLIAASNIQVVLGSSRC